jgi:hypothetical protein
MSGLVGAQKQTHDQRVLGFWDKKSIFFDASRQLS